MPPRLPPCSSRTYGLSFRTFRPSLFLNLCIYIHDQARSLRTAGNQSSRLVDRCACVEDRGEQGEILALQANGEAPRGRLLSRQNRQMKWLRVICFDSVPVINMKRGVKKLSDRIAMRLERSKGSGNLRLWIRFD